MNRVFSFYEILGGDKKVKAIIDEAAAKYDVVSWKNNYSWGIPQMGLTFNVLTAQMNNAPMASVIGVNDDKPLRSVGGYGAYGGNIPKIGHGYEIQEQTMRDEQIVFSRGGDVSITAIANLLFNHADRLIQGYHARLNNMDDQVRSTGKLKVSVDNNADGILLDVDYRVPASNYLKAGFGQDSPLAWSDPNANCIQDLIDMVKYADDNNIIYDIFEMTKTKWNQFASHPSVLSWVRRRLRIAEDAVDTFPVTNQEIKAALDGFDLPPITIADHKQYLEVDGFNTPSNGFEDDNVILRPSGLLGEMKNAVSMHALAPSSPTSLRTTVEGGRIAILNTWNDIKLINHIELEGYAVPTLSNPKNLVILDTMTAAS